MDDLYEIFRSYHPKHKRETEVVQSDLTLEEAQEHCQSPDSEEPGEWFEGYRRQ